MEVGLCGYPIQVAEDMVCVLILVLVEVGLCVVRTPFEVDFNKSLNPCFSGSWVVCRCFYQCIPILRLNPCFSGSWVVWNSILLVKLSKSMS